MRSTKEARVKLKGELLQHTGPAVLKLNTGNLIEIPAQRRGEWEKGLPKTGIRSTSSSICFDFKLLGLRTRPPLMKYTL